MRFRSVPLVLGLFASLWAGKSTEADFLIAQDFMGKSISSIAYTYSGSTAVKGAEAVIVSGFTSMQGVAAGGDKLFATGYATASNQVAGYTLGGSGGGLSATLNTSFGTSGYATLSAAGRGVSVTPDGSKISVALLSSLQAVNLDSTTGANTGPTLSLTAGGSNVYKSVQTVGGDYYVVNQPGAGTTPYAVNKFNSSGVAQGAITLTGFAPSTSALRDILFVGNNTFYLTNYASTANGGGLYKFNLSGTTATLDASFGTAGRLVQANTFGIAMDTAGTIFLSQYYTSSGGSSSIRQVNALTGASSIFKASDANFGFQYLATTSVPEPSTYALAALAVGVLGATRRKKALGKSQEPC